MCPSAWGLEIDASSATALNHITLYQDSTFVTEIGDYPEGSLFKILAESHYQHPDADQKQKFKWFRLEARDGKIGWGFGDGLAVFVPEADLVPALKPYCRKRLDLGSGFDGALTWVAAIHGRDNFHAEDYLNPLYSECYLVITSTRGKSVQVKCSGESVRGETRLGQLLTQDITGDGKPEIILERRTTAVGSQMEEAELEVFSMKAGTLASVFLEHLSLSYETHIPSPAISKFVEISTKTIRVSYLDYVTLEKYAQNYPKGPAHPRKERCMEYVTATYSWNSRNKNFQNLYGETRLAPQARLWEGAAALTESPHAQGPPLAYVQAGQRLEIIKHHEEYVVRGGQKKVEHWFFVQNQRGQQGYLPAKAVKLTNMEPAEVLNRYYLHPPLSKSEWSVPEQVFVSFK